MAISVSSLSEKDLFSLCLMNQAQIDRLLNKMSFRSQMELRRDVQIALTHYAKGKPILNAQYGDKVYLDEKRTPTEFKHAIQFRATALQRYIEKRCRNFYMAQMRNQIIMAYPCFANNPQKIKSLIKQKWLKFCKKFSY